MLTGLVNVQIKPKNMCQDDLPKQSKKANLAIATILDTCILYDFYLVFETPGLPRGPKDGNESSQDGSRQPSGASQNKKAVVGSNFSKREPKIALKAVQRVAKNWSNT